MRKQILAGVCLAAVLLAGCGGKNENFKKAEQALSVMNYEAALEGYQKSIEQQVKPEYSNRGAGIAAMNLGKYEDAINYFSQSFIGGKLSETASRDVLQYMATAYYQMGDYSNAMASCQDLMNYPMNAESYYVTGLTALALNSYDDAERNFQNAYSQDSSYEMAFRIYGAYMKRGMQANAAGYLEQALTIEPSNGEDYCSRGTIYYYLEQYEDALTELQKAAKKDSTKALLVMGEVYRNQKNYELAREKYEEYVLGEGPSAKGYNGLALCDIAEGQYESALSNINLGIACVDLDVTQDLMYNQVVVYEKMADYENAVQKLEAYLERYPNDEAAKREYVFLSSRIRQAQQAPVTEEVQEPERQEADSAQGDDSWSTGEDLFGDGSLDGGSYGSDADLYGTDSYGYDADAYGYDADAYGYGTDAYVYDETAYGY